jgi:hypothetical protein
MSLRARVVPYVFAVAVLFGCTATSAQAAVGPDFTTDVTTLSSSQARVSFTPTGFTPGLVIVHYLVNNVNQQNVFMTNAGGRWDHTIAGLSTGALITYSFTYSKNGVESTSQWFPHTHGSTGATPTPSPTTGPGPATPTPGPGPALSLEAESGTFSGAARRSTCGACSGGAKAGFIGNGSANFVTIHFSVASGGSRTMNIYYMVNGTRPLSYSVNGGTVVALSLSGTSWSTVAPPRAVTVTLNAGGNSVRFFHNSAFGPDLDRITISGGGPGPGTPTPTPTATVPGRATPTPTPTQGPAGCPTCTSKRLKIVNGCGQPMWIQFLTGNGGGTLNAPNRHLLASSGSSIEYDIPDKGLAGVRVWPGMGCDGNGHNCKMGASGGPPSLGFTCPAGIGCAPPIDTKWEGSFGCMPNIPSSQCQVNPSGAGVLGRNDWWNTSMVDGYTTPVRVRVLGNCPVGPQVDNPGGPVGGVVDCSGLRFSDCPRGENLSTNGRFPTLSNLDLLLRHPNPDGSPSGAIAGCFSPSGKLTMGQWQSLPRPPFTGLTFDPRDPQAEMYACPTPPISPAQCMAGPAARTAYTQMIHSRCNNTYAYPYDDTNGLLACPSATNLKYEVTFLCPQ